jgi:hypothetical protein
MKEVKEVYINDVCVAIPYNSFNQKKNIISDLELKRRRGYIIRKIEDDDNKQCIVYCEPNSIHN